MNALRDKKDELFDKFANGDLTKADYQAQLKPIETQLEDLTVARITDKVGTAMTEAEVNAAWDDHVKVTMAKAKAEGIDYFAPGNEEIKQALNDALIRIGKVAGAMKPKLSYVQRDQWTMGEALKEVEESFGLKRTGAASPPPPAAAPKTAAGTPPDLSQIPPSLRGAPTGADPGIQADEFAHLSNMSNIDREKAVAAMSPEQQERYLER